MENAEVKTTTLWAWNGDKLAVQLETQEWVEYQLQPQDPSKLSQFFEDIVTARSTLQLLYSAERSFASGQANYYRAYENALDLERGVASARLRMLELSESASKLFKPDGVHELFKSDFDGLERMLYELAVKLQESHNGRA